MPAGRTAQADSSAVMIEVMIPPVSLSTRHASRWSVTDGQGVVRQAGSYSRVVVA